MFNLERPSLSFLGTLQTVARIATKRWKLSLSWDKAGQSCTDAHSFIRLGWNADWLLSEIQSYPEWVAAVKGLNEHEIAHVLYSSSQGRDEYYEECLDLGIPVKVAKFVFNSLEDGRVNRAHVNALPKTLKYIRFINHLHYGYSARNLSPYIADQVINGFLERCRCGKDLPDIQFDTVEILDKIQNYIELGLKARSTRELLEVSAYPIVTYLWETLREIGDAVKPEPFESDEEYNGEGKEPPEGDLDPRVAPKRKKREPEESKNKSESKKASSKKEKSSSGKSQTDSDEESEESSKPSESGDFRDKTSGEFSKEDSAKESEGNPGEKSMDESEEESEVESKEISPDETEEGTDTSPEETDEPNLTEEASGEPGNPSSQTEEETETADPYESETSLDEASEGEETEEDYEEGHSEDSGFPDEGMESERSADIDSMEPDASEDEDLGQVESGESDTEESGDSTDQEADEWDENGDSSYPDKEFSDEEYFPNDEEFPFDIEVSEGTYFDGGEIPAGELARGADDIQEYEESEEELELTPEEEFEELLAEVKSEALEYRERDLEAEEEAKSLATEAHDPDEIRQLARGLHRGVSFSENTVKGSEKEYADLCAQMESHIDSMMESLESAIIRKKMAAQRNLRYGRLDAKRIWRAPALLDSRVFETRQNPSREVEMAFYVLVDGSGSMNGPNAQNAKLSACGVSEVLEHFKLPHTVVSFEADVNSVLSVVHHRHVRWGEQDKTGIAAYEAGHNNRDGFSVRAATEELRKRREQVKILLVLSDGMPMARGCCYSDRHSPGRDPVIKDVALAVEEAQAAGIEVVGFYFGDTSRSMLERAFYMYPKLAVIKNPADLPDAVSDVLVEILKKYL